MTSKEYYKSTRMVETRNWTLEMALNFAEEYAEALRKHAVMPSCEGNCGMNYCDDNGCIERKRILVDPTDSPEHEA